MALVRNDPERLAELADAIADFRAATLEGAAQLRGWLEVRLSQSWSDARYESFRETLSIELDRIRHATEVELEELERRLRRLRERLDDYHAASARTQSMSLQFEEYKELFRSGRLIVGELNVPSEVRAAAIEPPEQNQGFWNHHGNTKEIYMELARAFGEAMRLAQAGHGLEDLRKDEYYRRAIDAFRSTSDPIRLKKFGDIYVVEAGRHRVVALQECGIPFFEALVTTMAAKK
jgi:TolA-binding protein